MGRFCLFVCLSKYLFYAMHILGTDWGLFPSHFHLLIYLFKTAQFILSRYVGVLGFVFVDFLSLSWFLVCVNLLLW